MTQPTLDVVDANSNPVTVNTINPNGQAAMADSQPVVLPNDQVVLCDGATVSISATFNRPADTTAYAALDTVTDSTSSPTVMSWASVGGSGYITKAYLATTQSTCVARFRLHLYMATLSNTNDNAAFTILSGDFDNKIGTIDFFACATEGAGSTVAESLNRDIRLAYALSSGSTIFGRLETLDVFTPASAQTFTIKLTFEKNR